MKKLLATSALSLVLVAGTAYPVTAKRSIISSNESVGYNAESGEVSLGGFSGLTFVKNESTSEKYIFYTLTDRGPNAELRDFGDGNLKRPFILPSFTPQILKISYDVSKNKSEIIDRIFLKKADGKNATGLPNVDKDRVSENFDESPVDLKGKPLKFDPWGLDPESIAMDGQGNFWVGEEYGPSILKISQSGKILGRWFPKVKYVSSYKTRGGSSGLSSFFGKRILSG